MEFEQHIFLSELGLKCVDNQCCFDGVEWRASGAKYMSVNPNSNNGIGEVIYGNESDYERCMVNMSKVEKEWMSRPMPQRGEVVRQIGDALRKYKDQLGSLESLEMGKIKSEGDGEVQEFIDICDYACGLSRMLNGKVIPSERAEHYMMECWNPLGNIGVISAFNFPVAVFGWNLAIAMVCGNLTHWKGAPSTPLTTIATTMIINQVLKANNCLGILTATCGGADIGIKLVDDSRIKLVSFTGSTQVGRQVATRVATRFGKSILELGGNNATIIMPDANLELVIKGSVFAAVGTCGQRCTTLRRLIIHQDVFDQVVTKMANAYKTIQIGNSLDSKTLIGPLHTKLQIQTYQNGIQEAIKHGGKLLYGGEVLSINGGNFVMPTIIQVSKTNPVLKEELFVPILYVIPFQTLDEAIQINNDVPQGLSSSLFTNDLKNAFKWIGPLGSDCGIVNVNIGNSGAEIGGAFGGEKETGGGRESGSDSWKQYMRRSTCTINYGLTLPLAQGIKFDL